MSSVKNFTSIIFFLFILVPASAMGTEIIPQFSYLENIKQRFGQSPHDHVIVVKISMQQLFLYQGEHLIKTWPISSSKYGIGSTQNSQKTPLGTHRIAQKIGQDTPLGTLFVARRNTGKTVKILTDDQLAPGDYVTTRILWLTGLEEGFNKGPGIDSYQRTIYIHGTAEEGRIGRPASHGCIRMKNADVIELFQLVKEGTLVDIQL